MAEFVLINEVGPRDGLQSQPVMVRAGDKLRLIASLAAAGLRHIEVASFVSPKSVPQMADADALFLDLPSSTTMAYSALVPNLRGLERAQAAGVKEIAVVLAATETMNRRNFNMSLDVTRSTSVDVIRAASGFGMRTKAYIAVAFECPFEGRVAGDTVLALTDSMFDAGVSEVVIADTIGAANPTAVSRLLEDCIGRFGAERLSAHFHDTRGFGLANAWAALQQGIRKFDASVGGLGGCPFAPGAAGNVATEDLVLLFEQCGYETDIDVRLLREAVALAGELVGRQIGGRTSSWLHARDLRDAHPAVH